jgi:hypothetical protein
VVKAAAEDIEGPARASASDETRARESEVFVFDLGEGEVGAAGVG